MADHAVANDSQMTTANNNADPGDTVTISASSLSVLPDPANGDGTVGQIQYLGNGVVFTTHPEPSNGGWSLSNATVRGSKMTVLNALASAGLSYILFKDCTWDQALQSPGTQTMAHTNNAVRCEYVCFSGCEFTGEADEFGLLTDMFRHFSPAKYIHWKNNKFHWINHTALWLGGNGGTSGGVQFVLIKGNTFDSPKHPLEHKWGSRKVWVIQNTFDTISRGEGKWTCQNNNPASCSLASSGDYAADNDGPRCWSLEFVMIGNKIFRCGSIQENTFRHACTCFSQNASGNPERVIDGYYAINNTIPDNYAPAFGMGTTNDDLGAETFQNIHLINNICHSNNINGALGGVNEFGDIEIYLFAFGSSFPTGAITARGNLIGASGSTPIRYRDGVEYSVADAITNSWADATFDSTNISGDPDFADLAGRDVKLGASSEASGIGQYHTRMDGAGSTSSGSGSGTVDDPLLFYDNATFIDDKVQSTFAFVEGMIFYVKNTAGAFIGPCECTSIDYTTGAISFTTGSDFAWPDNADVVMLFDPTSGLDAGAEQDLAPPVDPPPGPAGNPPRPIFLGV